jgi:hypothetical protein
VVEAPFGSDEARFDFDIFFATITTNATKAQEATAIIATFVVLFSVFIGEVAFPVILLVLFLSDGNVELAVVSLTTGLAEGVNTCGFMNIGDVDMVGTAVGFVKMALGAIGENGKLIDKLNERLSPNNPRELLKKFNMEFGEREMVKHIWLHSHKNTYNFKSSSNSERKSATGDCRSANPTFDSTMRSKPKRSD